MDARPKRTWSVRTLGNRISYSLLVALLAFGAVQSLAVALIAGFVVFLLMSAIVSRRD